MMNPDWIDWRALKKAFAPQVALRSLWVALIVGTVLNAINQGSEILRGSLNLLRLALTYAVPFFVASFGAYSAFQRTDKPE